MRFASFKIVEDAERKIYSVGDSHADAGGIASYKGVINRAQGGQPSTSQFNYNGKHKTTGEPTGIDNVPPNQIVIISQGANDTANSMRAFIDSKGKTKLVPPATIASNVAKLVNAAKAKGHIVVFVLFPNGPGRGSGLAKYYGGDYQEEVRSAIKSAVNAPIIDLDGKGLAPDGIHATSGAYRSAAQEAIAAARSQSSPTRKVSNTAQSNRAETNQPSSDSTVNKSDSLDSPQLGNLFSDLFKNWLGGGKAPAFSAATLAGLGLSQNELSDILGKADDSRDIGTRRQSANTIYSTNRPATNRQPEKTDNVAKINRNVVSPDEISAYIVSKGLSRNHAAGMIANIKAESGFNSAAVNPNDKGARSIGFFQHRADRADKLEKAVPNWRTNWKGQIDFALSEPAGKKYASLTFRSPEAASRWFTINFERPANMVAVADTRARQASQYA